MCGIVGFASRTRVDAALLVAMRETMRHRGPDDAGLWQSPDGNVGFAMRRLAIIDLSPGGHQPMADGSGELHIVFNGEIYNFRELRHKLEQCGHKFRTASDTEVILEAYREWDEACVEHLNGMFAFALYDQRTRRLFVARDRAGEKPLFYRHDASGFLFASELKALMRDPSVARKLDYDAVHSYFAYGYVMGGGCILQGIRKLPPAHALSCDLETNSIRTWRYWKLKSYQPKLASPEDLEHELEDLLKDSIRAQLVADVPIGIMLSGGLDSSLLTAFAAQLSGKQIKTFNVSFPGNGSFDEGPYARIVARHFGTEHVELQAEPSSVALLPKLARQYDEPIADPSIVPTYALSRAIRQNVTVALGGDGGDELFGGYNHYNWLAWLNQMRRFTPSLARQLVGAIAAGVLPMGFRGRQYLIRFGGELAEMLGSTNLLFNVQDRKRLLADGLGQQCSPSPEEAKSSCYQTPATLLRDAMSMDFNTYLPDDILVKVDRASMLASLEVRAPYLDHRIVEFAFRRLPDSLRASYKERKRILRRIARRHLPSTLNLTRKQGFSPPLKNWFQGDWGTFIREVLSQADSSLFQPAYIATLLSAERQGLATSARLFAISMFELWRREYQVSL
jgi:asparagine synthase (glutamine-hydrolysing)